MAFFLLEGLIEAGVTIENNAHFGRRWLDGWEEGWLACYNYTISSRVILCFSASIICSRCESTMATNPCRVTSLVNSPFPSSHFYTVPVFTFWHLNFPYTHPVTKPRTLVAEICTWNESNITTSLAISAWVSLWSMKNCCTMTMAKCTCQISEEPFRR